METQRASLENNRRSHGESLGKTADGLLGNSMEGRQSDVFFAHALVEQRLDISLCVDAASPGNVIELRSLLCQ